MNKFWLTRVLLIALVLGVFAVQTPDTFAAEEGWLVSFEEAKAAAAKEKKTIFMEFTGSDWCPPCKALAANVLTQEAFKTQAPKNFILLKLDNPRDKSKQTDAEKAQYPKLAAQYKVTGVPTIFLADELGRPFAKMVGYRAPGDPVTSSEIYVKNLLEKNKIRAVRDAAFAKAAEAEGVAKAKFLDEAISVIDTELAVAVYSDTVKEIIGLDADNTTGLRAKYEGIQQAGVIKAAVAKIRRSSQGAKPADTIKAFDELITKHKPTGEALQEVLFAKSFAHFQAKEMVPAKTLLLEAKKLAPKSKIGKQVDSIITRHFKDVEVPEGAEAPPKK